MVQWHWVWVEEKNIGQPYNGERRAKKQINRQGQKGMEGENGWKKGVRG